MKDRPANIDSTNSGSFFCVYKTKSNPWAGTAYCNGKYPENIVSCGNQLSGT